MGNPGSGSTQHGESGAGGMIILDNGDCRCPDCERIKAVAK